MLPDAARVMGGFDFHHDRLSGHPGGQRLDLLRVSGAEQQGLALLRQRRDNRVQRVLEPHVQHAVCFVQDQRRDLTGFQRSLSQVFLNPARCAHDDVGPVFERANLWPKRHAAAQGQNLDVVPGPRQPAQFPGDLVSKFTGWTQHQ